LHLDLEERPNHPFVLFNLGMTYSDAGRHEEAIACLERCLRESSPEESHLRKAYALLVHSLAARAETGRAFEVCQEGRRIFPTDPELLFREGMLHHEFGRLDQAETSYRTLLEAQRERAFSSLDVGILSYKGMHNLAIVYQDAGKLDAALDLWQTIVKRHPSYKHGYWGLLRILLLANKLQDARNIVERMRDLVAGGTITEIDALRAEAVLALHDTKVDHARSLWQTIMDRCDGDEEVVQEGARFFFEHGPHPHARKVLKQLVEVNPRDAAGWHNLGSVHLMLGEDVDAVGCLERSLILRPESEATKAELLEACRRIGRDPHSLAVFGSSKSR
jgi:tetratricopeptide (TPR) repeat protein